MLRGGESGAREDNLARVGFCGLDQFLHIVSGKVRTRDDQQAGGRNLANRSERGQRIVTHIFPGNRCNNLTGGHDAERIAIGLRIRDDFIADDAAGARLVLDDDRLAELGLH